ncbi:hypothetical protein C8Q77DRAFT_1217676 [Trametes polyzona]|nr:hypothetical protein C8Q77DRAFT_1217676 [Trametes polyzona]
MEVDDTPETSPAQSTADAPESRPKRPSRVRNIDPRTLSEMRGAEELVYTVFCAITAHKEIYERAEGELHGDINPNSIIIFDHPTRDDQPAESEGALIYWDPPISIQTMRKIGNPDHPQPPPQRRKQYFMPPFDWYHHYC